MNSRSLVLALVASLGHVMFAAAQSRDVDRIVEQMERQMRSTSLEYTGEVRVTSRSGTERRKNWISFRQGSGKVANRLIRFLSPADVRGVAFLSLGRANGNADQWMYLPSMKRERRLAPQDRDASFVGTDFSYADLEEFDRTDYTASLEADQTVEREACYTIRLVPRARSPYTQQVLSVSQSRFVPLSISYYRQGRPTPAKVMSFFDYRQVDGYWVALRVEMADAVKGSRTVVRLTDVVFDQPQPSDRYTVQNLVREGADLSGAAGFGASPAANRIGPARFSPFQAASANRQRGMLLSGFSGSLDTGFLVFPKGRVEADDRALGWTRMDVRQQIGRRRVRIAAGARVEAETGGQLGTVHWDPADRSPRRSPLSLRELSVSATLARAIDLSVGRFAVAWGATDTHSPASGFLPRDLTDPLVWENLPLWGARLTGERGGFRFDVYDAFTTTPWRLPRLDGRFSPGARADLYFGGATEAPPTRGFQMVRLSRLGSGWDVTGWLRRGIRPAPLFAFDIDAAEQRPEGRFVDMSRRFASEQGAGIEINRRTGSWLLRGEASLTDSEDRDLGNAYFYTLQAEHAYRAGVVTLVYASRGPDTLVDVSTPFDRADVPSVTLAMTQSESWGEWRAAWLGTLENAGGLFDGEIARPLDAGWRLVVGVDIPHGSSISAMGAFSLARRLRTSLQFTW